MKTLRILIYLLMINSVTYAQSGNSQSRLWSLLPWKIDFSGTAPSISDYIKLNH